MKTGETYKIDTYNVKQWEEKRVVSLVTLLETPSKRKKWVLVDVEELSAICLVPRKDLKPVNP